MTALRGCVLTPRGRGWAYWPDGRIEFRAGRIVEVGPARGDEPADLRPHILFPGLVDAHAHVPQLPLCGVHSGDLLRWLRRWVFPVEARFRGARARHRARAFVREMVAQGTTSAALYASAWPDAVEACFEAAIAAGVHAWIGPPLMDVDGYRRVSTARVLEEAERLVGLDTPRVRLAVTPRFALSCTMELLQGAAELARRRGLPIQTHLAEQVEECRQVRRRFRVRSYTEVYERAGLVGPRSLFAHCVHLSAAEWRRIASAAVAHCPASNVFLGSGVMPWELARRMRVGLGSDVGAGPDLSIFQAARTAWMVQAVVGRAPDPGELLRASTLGGAEALGFASQVGSLEPGKAADILVLAGDAIVPPGAPRVESASDLVSRILHRAGRSALLRVYVGGRKVVEAFGWRRRLLQSRP